MSIHILYSSGGGNTKFVIDVVTELLIAKGHEVTQSNVITASPEELLQGDLTILACPTYDHGLMHTPFDLFLQKSREERIDLTGHRFALIGLGDSKYDSDYLVESIPLMQAFIIEQGAIVVGESLRIIANPVPQGEKIGEWVKILLEKI